MVTDSLWRASDLGCASVAFEASIGRRLVPADFKPGIPANDGISHGPGLRARMGFK
jgi:hypothetical protein